MEQYKGKAIYNPSGKAGEYSRWACNFYVGCSNGCAYCYLKKGRGKATLGGDCPVLKKCFHDKHHAIQVFEQEARANLEELRKYGLFFTFTSDPCLEKTIWLTNMAVVTCMAYGIPVMLLTKRANFIDGFISGEDNTFVDFPKHFIRSYSKSPFGEENPVFGHKFSNGQRANIAFGFTLTGHDELEPGADTNLARIKAMKALHEAGFKTWASIEPVIDIPSSLAMINLSRGFCDHYKIGLESGVNYPKQELQIFIKMVCAMFPEARIYFKDSLLRQAEIERSSLPANCVDRNFNLFKE